MAQNLQKNIPMDTQRLSKMKMSLFSKQLVPCFFHRLLFWSFCCRPGGYRMLKVVKNTVGSCKIEGVTFSRQNTYFARKWTLGHPKATPGTHRDTPRDPDGPILAGFLARSSAALKRYSESGQEKFFGPGKSLSLFPIYTYRYTVHKHIYIRRAPSGGIRL